MQTLLLELSANAVVLLPEAHRRVHLLALRSGLNTAQVVVEELGRGQRLVRSGYNGWLALQ